MYRQQQQAVQVPLQVPQEGEAWIFCKSVLEIQLQVFASCTSDFDPENRPWCATDLNDRGEQVLCQVKDHFDDDLGFSD